MPDVAILLLMTQLQWLPPAKRAFRPAGGIRAGCRVKINEVVFVPGCLNRNNLFAGLEFSLEFDLGLGLLLGLVSWQLFRDSFAVLLRARTAQLYELVNTS